MQLLLWVLVMFSSSKAEEVLYHTFYGIPLTKEEIVQQTKANTTFWCSIGVKQPCDPNAHRLLDGTCNNLQHPSFGGSHTPIARVLRPEFGYDFQPRPAQSGRPEPPCRHIRTTLLASGIRPDPLFTLLATHFFVFAAADTVSIQDTVNYVLWKPFCCVAKGKTDPLCTPIQVPTDDPVHRFSGISSATPVIDMSVVYGNSLKNALEKGRLFSQGLLKYELENGRVFPPSTRTVPNVCLLNQPPHETKCYNTPEDGMNSVFGINIVSVWFWRYHNRLASALANLNPCWSDDKLFYTARDINIASYTQILYYELLPLLLGWNNLKRDSVVSESRGFRDKYNPNVLPQISLEYPYILRWAHLMQEGRLKMYDERGNYLKQVPIVNLTLRSGFLAVDNNIDYVTQGSFRQPSGKIDYTIDPDISEKILGGLQRASDVASSDLEKGRYMGFPPYIEYIKYCSGNTIKNFDDLVDYIDTDKLDLLRDLYQHVRDIELMAGTWVEKPVRDGFVPPTFYCIVVDQLLRSMVSDRHWYERPNRPNAFTLEQLLEIRKITISRILCDVGDKVSQIQKRGFERARPGFSNFLYHTDNAAGYYVTFKPNQSELSIAALEPPYDFVAVETSGSLGTESMENEMVSCEEIEEIDFTLWKDNSCSC